MLRRIHLLAVALAATCGCAAHAAWITFTRGDLPEAALRTEYLDAQGNRRIFGVVSKEPKGRGAASLQVPGDVNDVVWTRLVPDETAAKLDSAVLLLGKAGVVPFLPSEVSPPDPPPTPGEPEMMPLGTDLLPSLHAATFGAEKRVTVRTEDGALLIETAPGPAPAGVILTGGPWYLPAGADAALESTQSGTGRYIWSVSDRLQAAKESPVDLGSFTATEAGSTVTQPLPAGGLDRASWTSWTLACPTFGGRLRLQRVRLVAADSSPSAPRALWAWQSGLWLDTPDLLKARIARYGIQMVFITVPIDEGSGKVRTPDALRQFIAECSGRGVQVWAVEGDPHAILPSERPKFVRRARAFAAFNRTAPTGSRLSGIQYDIEPYLVKGFQLDREDFHRAYLDTLAALKEAVNMPMEAVVPFWYGKETVGRRLLVDLMAPAVDSIAVMDYRTDPAAIVRLAEPFLAAGARNGDRIRIALEAGAIDDTEVRTYRAAPTGELWLSRMDGRPVLALLKSPRKNPKGSAYSFSHSSLSPGSRITFHQNKQALLDLMPRLEEQLGAWKSFDGIALHEIE